MSEMVERVAMACHAAIEETMPARVRQKWADISPLAKAAMFVRARAALEAMRGPTEAMIQAACDATFWPNPLTPEAAHRRGWQAMIDTALEPTP